MAKTILVSGDGLYKDGRAAEIIQPGKLVRPVALPANARGRESAPTNRRYASNTDTVARAVGYEVQDVANARGPIAFARENEIFGKGAETQSPQPGTNPPVARISEAGGPQYAVGDQVLVVYPQKGAEVNARVTLGNNVALAVGQRLAVNTSGDLIPAAGEANAIAVALEAVAAAAGSQTALRLVEII